MTVDPLALKALHQLHIQFFETQTQIEKGPKLILARQKLTQKIEGELTTAKEQLKENKMAADRKSLDLKSNESKIETLKSRLNTASSNKEFNIIKGQIDADTMANSVLEDEILELFDAVEEATDAVKKSEQAFADAQEEEKAFIATQNSKIKSNETKRAELNTKIIEVAKILPAQCKEDYDRLVNKKGSEAMAPAEEGICQNCYVSLTSQKQILLNTGEIVFCKSCGALLYNNSEPQSV